MYHYISIPVHFEQNMTCMTGLRSISAATFCSFLLVSNVHLRIFLFFTIYISACWFIELLVIQRLCNYIEDLCVLGILDILKIDRVNSFCEGFFLILVSRWWDVSIMTQTEEMINFRQIPGSSHTPESRMLLWRYVIAVFWSCLLSVHWNCYLLTQCLTNIVYELASDYCWQSRNLN